LLDEQYNVPIEFANISIGKTMFISDLAGSFVLPDKYSGDTIKIQHISYYEKAIAIKDLPDYSVENKIKLKPKIIQLSEVVVSNKKSRLKRIGCNSNSNKMWDEIRGSGIQLASKINWSKSKGSCRLKELNFNVLSFSGDSILIAVKFYKLTHDTLGESICNVFMPKMIRPGDKAINVDLKPYNIRIEEDFIVGIKGIKCYGKNPRLRIPVGIDLFNGKVFATYPSKNGQYTRTKKGGSYGYNLLVEY